MENPIPVVYFTKILSGEYCGSSELDGIII